MAKSDFHCSEPFVTPKGRVAFPHLDELNNTGKYPDNRYKLDILLPKDTTDMSVLKAAFKDVAQKAGVSVKDCKLPVKDGDKKAGVDGYAGCWVLTPKAKRRPGCVNANLENIKPTEIYGGCYARAQLYAFYYESQGEPGITLGLNHVQFLADGERFGGGGGLAEDAFNDGVTPKKAGPDRVEKAMNEVAGQKAAPVDEDEEDLPF